MWQKWRCIKAWTLHNGKVGGLWCLYDTQRQEDREKVEMRGVYRSKVYGQGKRSCALQIRGGPYDRFAARCRRTERLTDCYGISDYIEGC